MNIKKFLMCLIMIGFMTVGSESFASWNNDNFINESFWTSNPKTGAVINALFGDGLTGNDKTAYTKTWNSNTCDTNKIIVKFISGYINGQITWTGNRIYVVSKSLGPNNRGISSSKNCFALISTDTTLKVNGFSINTSNNIFDNITFNTVSTSLIIGGSNNTLHNIISNLGLSLSNANYNYLNNFKIMIGGSSSLSNSNNNIFNNIHIYNVTSNGFTLNSSNRNTFNNTQSNNNGSQGFYFGGTDSGNVLNNVMAYNCNSNGLAFYRPTLFHNAKSFNNLYGYTQSSSASLRYFDGFDMFGNTSNQSYSTSVQGTTQYNYLGRGAGYHTSPVPNLEYSLMTNVKNGNGTYLINTGGTFASNMSNKSRTNTEPLTYVYGTGVFKQTRPVRYDNVTLVSFGTTGADWDTSKYITEFSLTNFTGEITPPDILSPVVTLNGSASVQHQINTPFTDPGATWTDDTDGNGTISAYNSGSINTAVAGFYTVEYIYTDVAGNKGSARRTVEVIDLSCFSLTDVSYLGDICFGIPESTIKNNLGQGISFAQLELKTPMRFDLRIKNITFGDTTVDYIRTRLGTFNVKQTIQSNAITNISDINGKIFKKNEFEKIAKDVKL